MKLYFSPASPFVRKVLVVAHEIGLAERIEKLPSKAHPVNRSAEIIAFNPLGQVPTFFADDGNVLYDSRVICEYLDDLVGGAGIFPKGNIRWTALVDQSTGDGLLDAALLARYEKVVRPEPYQWEPWRLAQMEKVTSVLSSIERSVAQFNDRVDIGTITIGCGLGYLDFRFPEFAWRSSYPDVAEWFEVFGRRESMVRTTHVAP